MLTKLYVTASSRVACARQRLVEERGDSMLEYAILAAVVLAVLAVGALLMAVAAHDQATAVQGGINAIPVGNFNP